MTKKDILLQNFLKNNIGEQKDTEILAYALESFAEQVDNKIQNELLTRLILNHSAVAKQLEILNAELAHREEIINEAQKIAMLGRWDTYQGTGEMIWSNSMYEILEVDPDTPPSSDLFLLHVHPDDLSNVNLLYRQMFGVNESWTIRYRLLMEDGRNKWVYLRHNFTTGSKDKMLHNYGTIQDVTEMKEAEEKLEKYSQHLEELVEEKVKEISVSQMATIYALINLSESRDDDTGAHIERTASFCRLLAEKAQSTSSYANEIDNNFIETIYKASPLHDIGKVGIPDSILLKPGKLTDDEFTIMKTHVQIGYQTLAKIEQLYAQNAFLKMGMDIVLYHHEKWNGSGYINGLSGEKIPLAARIMAIADVYDALRSKRVYKEAFSHEKSFEIITSSKGSHFDPVLVDIFAQTQEQFNSLYESLK